MEPFLAEVILFGGSLCAPALPIEDVAVQLEQADAGETAAKLRKAAADHQCTPRIDVKLNGELHAGTVSAVFRTADAESRLSLEVKQQASYFTTYTPSGSIPICGVPGEAKLVLRPGGSTAAVSCDVPNDKAQQLTRAALEDWGVRLDLSVLQPR